MQMFEILDGELDALSPMPLVGKRRHTCIRRVLIQVSDDPRDKSWSCNTQNISQEGIALVIARPFDLGLMLTLEVARRLSPEPFRLEGTVVHATPKGPNLWLVGCKLSATLTPAELEQFLDDV